MTTNIEEGTGMVSHWVTALLQTAGMYGQSNMLSSHAQFLYLMGALFFLFSSISVVTSVALQGDFGKLLYLLVCPGLFLCMITFKTDACSVRLQFGFTTVDDSCTRLRTPLRKISKSYYGGTSDHDIQNAHVSWFYVQFDRVVSEIVQQTVSVITETRDNKHLLKLARERLIVKLSRARTSNPIYQELLGLALLGECADATTASIEIATSGQADSIPSVIADVLTEGDLSKRTYSRISRAVDRYNLLKEQPVWVDNPIREILRQDKFAHFIDEVDIDPEESLTCEQIWQMVIYGAYLGVDTFFEPTVDDKRILSPLFLLDNQRWYDEVVSDVITKIYSGPSDDMTLIPGVSGDNPDREKAAMVLASFYLRNSLIYNKLGATSVRKQRYEGSNEAASRVDYSMVAQHEAGANALELLHFSSYVPYAQGLILYFLSISFPFFALFLLIPGRQKSFTTWLSVWAWAKSWDIGFAMVNVLRDVMWHLTPSFASENTLYGISDLTGVDVYDMSSVIAMAFQNDPIQNFNMYFFIVSMFTIGVPIISAQMFAGASQALSAISGGKGNGMNPKARIVDKKSESGAGGEAPLGQTSQLNLGSK